jgi:cyclohexadienyl dehydratase
MRACQFLMVGILARTRIPRRASWLLVALLLLSSRLAAAPSSFRDTELLDRVIALIDRRLAVMPEVAAIKFRQQKPIADPAREREVLEQSVADARAIHLDAGAARVFFELQIQMARAVQEDCFARWRNGSSAAAGRTRFGEGASARTDALGRELLPAIFLASAVLTETSEAVLQARLSHLRRHAGTTEEQVAELARTLGGFRITAPATWGSLERVGVLRVGITGDYAPFSDDRGGTLQGLDYRTGRGLAKSWGFRVMFVRTTWPTLMDDLGKRRFDLAGSGISITAERRRQAEFSVAYVFDGKTPIARREDAARFSSLPQIDQPGVRVIVNPGGTNERFARDNLKHATILVHPDNRTISTRSLPAAPT